MDNLTSGNPLAHRVRVYYEGSETIYEGMPVCYNYLTTKNWFGGSVSNAGVVIATNTTAEGSHNEGKYIRVNGPIQVSATSGTSTAGSNVITDNGNEYDNLQVGMAVSVASSDDDAFDGNYVISAVDTTNNTITLEMTTAQAALVTAQTDVTVHINNLLWFAGTVSKGGWCGTTGPKPIDIYVPNGAIVPVYTDNDCTVGKTIMAIESASNKFTTPGWGRSVGVAEETVDRSSTAGLCLMKLDPNLFICQGTDNRPLTVANEEGTCVMTNQMYVESAQTAGSLCLVDFQGVLNGAADFAGGMFKFKGHLNAAASDLVQTVSIGLNIQASGEFDAAGGAADYVNCPLRLAVGTTGTPDLSNAGAASVLAAIGIGYHADESGGAPGAAYVFHFNSGATYQWDGLINTMNKGDLGDWAEASHITTSATGDRIIPVRFGNVAYHLIAYADDGK